jgi:hypothetical protein
MLEGYLVYLVHIHYCRLAFNLPSLSFKIFILLITFRNPQLLIKYFFISKISVSIMGRN